VLEPADRVRLGTFGAAIAITPAPLTGAASVMQAAAGFAEAVGGSSPLWDALDTAAAALEGATGRRGVIVVTDGRSTANRIGFADILARLERDRLPIFVVALDLKDLRGPDPAIRLRQLAEKTGGKYFFVKRGGVGVVIKRAVAALRGE
jgi:Mg-chelatase subunit ChlD